MASEQRRVLHRLYQAALWLRQEPDSHQIRVQVAAALVEAERAAKKAK